MVCEWLCKLFVRRGKIIFSSILAIVERRAMSLYDVPLRGFLLGLGMEITLPSFQIWGIFGFWLRRMLYSYVGKVCYCVVT